MKQEMKVSTIEKETKEGSYHTSNGILQKGSWSHIIAIPDPTIFQKSVNKVLLTSTQLLENLLRL